MSSSVHYIALPFSHHLTGSFTGTRKYVPCLYVYNKIDSISLEEVNRLARQEHCIVISCEMNLK